MILLKEDFAFKENLFYFMYICILCYNLILDELKDEEKQIYYLISISK